MTGTGALEAWQALNDRQQGTLAVIYELDRENEAAHRQAGARGKYSRQPASAWRPINFAHDPSGLGRTEMQSRLDGRGWHNQGNGSTIAALRARGLITESSKPTSFGSMLQVRLTREGRAAARAGLGMPATPKAPLGERAWEVLTYLWDAGQRGGYLEWEHSSTIDNVLIGKHVPPLAEPVSRDREAGRRKGGYRITDRGREFYREHYAAHTAAHPGVKAPHPDGADAEPWPAQADEILTRHWQYYRALCTQWEQARTACEAAGKEAAAAGPELPGILPAAVTAQVLARHQLWTETARQRAGLAAGHAGDLEARAQRAARAYAVSALAAFRAAVLHNAPLDVIESPGESDDWDEQPLPPPTATGIHAIDAEAGKLHADAVGVPERRRGPRPSVPSALRRSRYAAVAAATPAPPGAKLAALADFLRLHTSGGALTRRLHRS